MSLPLTRRIAQAALLVGAAAAPLIGAGAAHADVPRHPLAKAAPAAHHTATPHTGAGQTAALATDATGRLVGATAESAGSALPLAALPNTGALPSTDQLPLKGLPLT